MLTTSPHLHFVKMDIRAAFDTIDQGMMMDVLLELFDTVKSHPRQALILRIMIIQLHATLRCCLLPAKLSARTPQSYSSREQGPQVSMPSALANLADDTALFRHHAIGTATAMRNAVFVDLVSCHGWPKLIGLQVRNDTQTRQACLDLLNEHVQSNMVQVSGDVLRQKRGIPQGSKVSSMLCSLLYAHLENRHLGWTRQDGCVRVCDFFTDLSYC